MLRKQIYYTLYSQNCGPYFQEWRTVVLKQKNPLDHKMMWKLFPFANFWSAWRHLSNVSSSSSSSSSNSSFSFSHPQSKHLDSQMSKRGRWKKRLWNHSIPGDLYEVFWTMKKHRRIFHGEDNTVKWNESGGTIDSRGLSRWTRYAARFWQFSSSKETARDSLILNIRDSYISSYSYDSYRDSFIWIPLPPPLCLICFKSIVDFSQIYWFY